jgi:acetolactate synthase I/II/III large subunit
MTIQTISAPVTTDSQPKVTAGRVLVAALRMHGVDRVFCVPGESYLEVLDALHDEPAIELVVAKHEGAAACMAEADGKLTGRPGICMVTRGPGATHASVGIHIAQQDSTPMILFVGQIARDHRGRESFQEVDYGKMFGSLAKLVIEVDNADRMPELLARAFSTAVSGRPGPVVISLPEDMLTELTTRQPCQAAALVAPSASANTIGDIEEALRGAKRPLVIVGGSLWNPAGCAALQRFVGEWALPVACSFRRQDVLDNRNAQYVGHMSLGMSPALKRMVEEADLILALGTRLGDVMTDGYSLLPPPTLRQQLIHVHPDAFEIGRVYQATLALQADPNSVAEALSGRLAPNTVDWREWAQHGRQAYEAFSSGTNSPAPVEGVDLTAAMLHLSEVLPDDAVISNGAGNYSVWLHRFYRYRSPRTELATTCGSMGYGLPAAIAAAMRDRQRTVVCVAGDGCFMMYPQELATAVEHGVSIIVLVVNNGIYGTIRMHQERDYPGRVSGTRLQGPDYVALARAFGARAEQVCSAAEFAPALARARSQPGVVLLELLTDPMQITPQMRLSST